MAQSNTFQYKIEGLEELTKRYAEAPNRVEPILQQAIVKSAAILASHTTPENIPWRSGTLARSFDPAKIDRLLVRWFPRVDYARAVQFGMDPEMGRYVPAIKKRLKNDVGKYGNQKNIGIWPGFEGRHYMEKIMNSSTQQLNELFRNALVAVRNAMQKGGSINQLDSNATSVSVSGTTSKFSNFVSKISSKAGAKLDQLTYRPFKGAPRGYQARLAKKFPKLFKRWRID